MTDSDDPPDWLEQLWETMDVVERDQFSKMVESISDFTEIASKGALARELTDQQKVELSEASTEFFERLIEILEPPWEQE